MGLKSHGIALKHKEKQADLPHLLIPDCDSSLLLQFSKGAFLWSLAWLDFTAESIDVKTRSVPLLVYPT